MSGLAAPGPTRASSTRSANSAMSKTTAQTESGGDAAGCSAAPTGRLRCALWTTRLPTAAINPRPWTAALRAVRELPTAHEVAAAPWTTARALALASGCPPCSRLTQFDSPHRLTEPGLKRCLLAGIPLDRCQPPHGGRHALTPPSFAYTSSLRNTDAAAPRHDRQGRRSRCRNRRSR